MKLEQLENRRLMTCDVDFGARPLAIGDMDGDGATDVMLQTVPLDNGGHHWDLNNIVGINGKIDLEIATEIDGMEWVDFQRIDDMDHDGKDDIVVHYFHPVTAERRAVIYNMTNPDVVSDLRLGRILSNRGSVLDEEVVYFHLWLDFNGDGAEDSFCDIDEVRVGINFGEPESEPPAAPSTITCIDWRVASSLCNVPDCSAALDTSSYKASDQSVAGLDII